MGFAVEVGSTLPTMVGPIVKEWVEVHTKTLIARGLNLLNYYIFCGGTSTGYRTGRRDISSYDFDSAVHEWGELADKYYTARRMGGALNVFRERTRAHPARGGHSRERGPRGEHPGQRGEKSVFIFPRNLTRSMQTVTCRLDIPGEGEIPFPLRAPLCLKPQSMKMLPANIPLDGAVTLVWTTSEVFAVTRREEETVLVLTGEPGEKGEVFLRGIEGFDHIRGAGAAEEHDGGLLVTFTHSRGASHIRLMVRGDDNLPAALRGFRIVLVDTATAETTWIASDGDFSLPLVSDAYFMDFCRVEGLVLRAEVSRRPGGGGFVEFPWYANPVIPPEASLGGVELATTVDKQLRTVRIALPPIQPPEIAYRLENWRMRPENPRDLSGGEGWKPYAAFRGNERSGEHEGGYYVYRLGFAHEGGADGIRISSTNSTTTPMSGSTAHGSRAVRRLRSAGSGSRPTPLPRSNRARTTLSSSSRTRPIPARATMPPSRHHRPGVPHPFRGAHPAPGLAARISRGGCRIGARDGPRGGVAGIRRCGVGAHRGEARPRQPPHHPRPRPSSSRGTSASTRHTGPHSPSPPHRRRRELSSTFPNPTASAGYS